MAEPTVPDAGTPSMMARIPSMMLKGHGRGLPPVSSWPHHPLLFRVNSEAPVLCESGVNLPINHTHGIPFETKVFSGEVLCRIRGVRNSQDPWAPGQPLEGKKRLMSLVMQGKFKRKLSFADAKSGFECQRPLQVGFAAKGAIAMCKVIQPGLESDIGGPKPYVRNYLAAAADSINETPAGEKPPSITLGEPPERCPWIGENSNKKIRRSRMKNEAFRKQHYFDPACTYTFGFHSDRLDYLKFGAKLHAYSFLRFEGYLDGQPFPFVASSPEGLLWNFELWHTAVLPRCGEGVWEPVRSLGFLPPGRRSRVSLPFIHEPSTFGKTASVLSSRRRASAPPSQSESSDEEDPDLIDAQLRLAAVRREQRLLVLQMSALVATAPTPQYPSPPPQAHVVLREAVEVATEKAAVALRAEQAAPFDACTTEKYLTLVLQHCSKVKGKRRKR